MKFKGEIPQWAIDALKANLRARYLRQMPDKWFWVDRLLLNSGYNYEL